MIGIRISGDLELTGPFHTDRNEGEGASESNVKHLFSSRKIDGTVALKKRAKRNSGRVSLKFLVPAAWRQKSTRSGSLFESFYHAFHGLSDAISSQRNLRIHLSLSLSVVVAGICLSIDLFSWMALVIVMGMVISAELFNTALEHLVDVSTQGEYRYYARLAKDTAAAAVLVVSFAAVIVGLIVFVPRLLAVAGI